MSNSNDNRNKLQNLRAKFAACIDKVLLDETESGVEKVDLMSG
jgi:hypothetical protein